MDARLIKGTNNVAAYCPDCQALASFEAKHVINLERSITHLGETYRRTHFVVGQCASCHRGGYAEIVSNGKADSIALRTFFPISIKNNPLPSAVPTDIVSEYREAEQAAAMGLNRAASALFRSVLEKTLKANGYVKGNDPTLRDLQKRIDAAASDGIITQARQKRAHEDIRALGNDVLHEDWRIVEPDEVEDAHQYMMRILEDLYDDRPTVEAILKEKKKLP